ncbi:Abi family protein, partial [Shouchella clausii]|uniref:Abi family protein n=1 Tax=Shouchella clausii TaxID=79880 RepID=UPI0015C77010
ISFYKDNFYSDKNNGNFIDLDFGYLRDLSTIDMHIRYTFLKLCLDIEHGIKTYILAYFNKKDPTEGYSIVDRYIQSQYDQSGNSRSPKEFKLKLLEYAKLKSHHLNQLYYDIENDLKTNINIWELIECVSLNKLIEFFIFFKKAEIDKKENTSYKGILYAFRHIRNICAHNSPFLIDLKKTSRRNNILKERVDSKIDISNQRISDISSLFYLHEELIQSQGIRDNRRDELLNLVERINRNTDFYHHSNVKKIFDNMNNLVDILFNK